MKRVLIALMLCLVSIMSLVSCSNNNSKSNIDDAYIADSIKKVEEQRVADSIKKVEEQRVADSIKKVEDSINNIILKKYSNCLKRTVDEFDGTVKIEMPYNNIRIIKYINPDKTESYYLSTTIYDSYCTVSGSGLTILFEDSTKFERPYIDIDCNYYGGGKYTYSCFATLLKDDIKLFGEKKITKYKMFIFKDNINSSYAEKFQNYSKCILLMK